MPAPLAAISPLDGRYADLLDPLRAYASEGALIRARTRVEIEYLIALSELSALPLEIAPAERDTLRQCYDTFDDSDAERVKRIETEGTERYPATNHDVKAVEYWLRDQCRELGLSDAIPFIHFGLTSEDVNNLAYRLLVRGAVSDVVRPELSTIHAELATGATAHADVPMLARTHGQPATPTTYGKELAVFADRLEHALNRIDRATAELQGKLGGASGTLAAHAIAEPSIEWRDFAREFVESFELEYLPRTTQVNPADDLGALFDALAGACGVILDLDRDLWRYVSDGYLGQSVAEDEVGSSTMPHKVNPIDFENSEGNLERARSELRFLADYLATSRLQRDLSDSTVKRTIGTALGHSYLGFVKTSAGLETVAPRDEVMREDLEREPAVLAEAIQTALRRIGDPEAYERVKTATRGQHVDDDTFDTIIEEIRAEAPELADRLEALGPTTYLGDASTLARDVADDVSPSD